jgi:hypothetical protein
MEGRSSGKVMFLVTTFTGGQVIETIASRHDLHTMLNWCEDDHPIIEIFNGKVVEMTMTIRRATQEDIERVNV